MILLATMLSALASPGVTEVSYHGGMLPAGLNAQQGIAWDDNNGRNVLTWSTAGSITISHRVIDDGKLYWYRQLSVETPECEDGDLTFAMDDAVTLSDADHDGIGEISFGIQTACITDMSAKNLDLYLWEDGAMHQLWGETVWWNMDGTGTVMVPQLSSSLTDQPALRAHILSRFESTVASEHLFGAEAVVLHFDSVGE